MKIRLDVEEAPLEINMTPMIDIVFQLLIFFMCSIHFRSLEGKLLSYLPPRGLRDGPSHVEIPPEIDVSLTWDESSASTRYAMGEFSFSDPAAAVASVSHLYEVMSRSAPLPVVKISSEPRVPWHDVVAVLDGCKSRRITRVEFQAAPPAEGRR